MKKAVTFLLALVLVTVMSFPVLASDYRRLALEYLAEQYGVPAEEIQIYEGEKIVLEYLQEAFWCAKYELAVESTSQPAPARPPEAIEPAPPVRPVPEPVLPAVPSDFAGTKDPDTPVSSTTPAALDSPLGSVSFGIVYIREKTGEILDDLDMEAYFRRERELAAVAWEKLRQEAGKVDVNFYQRLQKAAPQDKFFVRIFPVFTETPELVQRFRELQAAYPEYAQGISAPSELWGTAGSTPVPVVTPEVVVPPSRAEAAADAPLLREKEGAGSMSAGGAVEAPASGRSTMENYADYFRELEAIRLAGLEAAARTIAEKLTALGVAYTYEYGMMTAELTKAEVNDLAALDAVSYISDDLVYAAENRVIAVEAEYSPPVVPDGTAAAASDAGLMALPIRRTRRPFTFSCLPYRF